MSELIEIFIRILPTAATQMPMEVQILHYNTKYAGPEAAAEQPDGLAGLSAFLQMDVTVSNNLDYVYDVLPNVTLPGSSHILGAPFPLAFLLPDLTGEFYRWSLNSIRLPQCTGQDTFSP